MPNNGHHSYDQPLFPGFDSGVSEAPLTEAEIDAKASAIAAAAMLHDVVEVNRVSEAADDQGHTPRFGIVRPTIEEVDTAVATSADEDRFKLDSKTREIGTANIAAIMESLSSPNRPKTPRF